MKINDLVYGDEEITEKVLLDLIDSAPVQRLKGISQQGLPSEYHFRATFSRYEHSIGVLILLRRFGAEIEEQISGLLHDISHTAFSHVVDWIAGDPSKEDYQDSVHLNILENSNIPEILLKYGFDYKKIAEIKSYSLLENEIPSVCADRLDYALREIKDFESKENINLILNNFLNYKGEIVFSSSEAAEIFSRGYLKCNEEHWAAPETKARYAILSNILKNAINKNIISFEDLKKTDKEVVNKLLDASDEDINLKFELLRKGLELNDSLEGEEDSVELITKKRYIDPFVLVNDDLKRLSSLSKDYNDFLQCFLNASQSKFVKIRGFKNGS
jgi:uncharacterized protein